MAQDPEDGTFVVPSGRCLALGIGNKVQRLAVHVSKMKMNV